MSEHPNFRREDEAERRSIRPVVLKKLMGGASARVIWLLGRTSRRRLLRRCRTGVRWGEGELIRSELGRLALRGELELVLATAGADYARHWRGYIASLCAPRALCSALAPTAAERWARCGS